MDGLTEEWEHHVAILEAYGMKQKEFIQARWPGVKATLYDPRALIPLLDEFGKQGWELVSAQPVLIGTNGDITYEYSLDAGRWTHQYLCFFKRRKLVR
jgi:hypothetical protein